MSHNQTPTQQQQRPWRLRLQPHLQLTRAELDRARQVSPALAWARAHIPGVMCNLCGDLLLNPVAPLCAHATCAHCHALWCATATAHGLPVLVGVGGPPCCVCSQDLMSMLDDATGQVPVDNDFAGVLWNSMPDEMHARALDIQNPEYMTDLRAFMDGLAEHGEWQYMIAVQDTPDHLEIPAAAGGAGDVQPASASAAAAPQSGRDDTVTFPGFSSARS